MIGVLTHHWAKDDKIDEARRLLEGNGRAQSQAPGFGTRTTLYSLTDPTKITTLVTWRAAKSTISGAPARSDPPPWPAPALYGPARRSQSDSNWPTNPANPPVGASLVGAHPPITPAIPCRGVPWSLFQKSEAQRVRWGGQGSQGEVEVRGYAASTNEPGADMDIAAEPGRSAGSRTSCSICGEFVDGLKGEDWEEIGVDRYGDPMGAPSYHPRGLLGVWLYGFMSGVRSSRKLEAACRDQIPYLWLTGCQRPDHVTLWRFYHAPTRMV